jgi:hypothetical protein
VAIALVQNEADLWHIGFLNGDAHIAELLRRQEIVIEFASFELSIFNQLFARVQFPAGATMASSASVRTT